MIRISLMTALLSVTGAAIAGEVGFSSKPAVRRAGDPSTGSGRGKTTVSFAVSAPTDVEVSVLDAEGRVVRHLAAGVLGGKTPPPPPLAAGLSQSIEWDGRDDCGKPVLAPGTRHPAPLKVRVRLGMRAELDGFIGHDPAAYHPLRPDAGATVRALATGPNGELFAFYFFSGKEHWSNTFSGAVFDRRGRYLRTIVPYRASLPEESLEGLRRVRLECGTSVPYIYCTDKKHGTGRGRAFLPVATRIAGSGAEKTHRAVVSADGRVAFVSPPLYDAKSKPQAVFAIGADGSVPEGGPQLAAFPPGTEAASLALSPDGRTIYAAVALGRQGAVNTVFRLGWGKEEPEPFVTKGLDRPAGAAVDGAGNLYVADKGNNRVAVYKPDGSALGELKVKSPERVEVHPGTGAVYVLGGPGVNELRKFESWKAPAPRAKAVLPTFKGRGYTAVMALDASAQVPVLWVAPSSTYARFALLRIEDRGDVFGDQVDVARSAETPLHAYDTMNLSFSRPAGVLNVGSRFLAAAGGEYLDPGPDARRLLANWEGAFGLDGNFYIQGGRQTFRLGPDFKPLPFSKPDRAPDLGKPMEKAAAQLARQYGAVFNWGNARLRGRGITADRAGSVFALVEVSPSLKDPTALWKYNPDGSMAKGKLIDSEFRSMESVRLDPQGNIYVALSVRPGRQLVPKELEGQVPVDPGSADARTGADFYPSLYGSIVKFGPEGGVVKKGCGGTPCNFGFGGLTEVKDARWIHFGANGTLGFDASDEPTHHCACQSSRFDVDSYGRVFYPDAGRFRVGMLDSAGNEIGWFGSYGNADSAGPKSAVPVPEIPLAWPQAVAADDAGTLYVGDRFSRRVAVVRLRCAVEENVVLP